MLDDEAGQVDRDGWATPDPDAPLTPGRIAIRQYPVPGGGELGRFLAASDAAATLDAWFGSAFVEALPSFGVEGVRQTVRLALDHDIADLDIRISQQLNVVLEHPALQKLEAIWRGIAYLLEAVADDSRVRLRILPVTWAEIAKDFNKALEFDQSALFDKVYSEEFGTAGGQPYGLLLCDHMVRHRQDAEHRIDDVSVLAGLSQVAAAAFAPCLVGAAPQLLGVEDFADLAVVQDVTSIFRTAEYQRWRDLQSRVDSRFIGLVMPRVLLRPAWGDTAAREDGFRYGEGEYGRGSKSWLWGNGIFALGAVAIRAFRDWGWFADIRGTRVDRSEAGLIDSLPSPTFSTGEPTAFRRPIEVEFTDRRQRALEEFGLIALSPCRLMPSLAVLGAPSFRMPEGAGNTIAAANEKLSAMMPYVLCVSRFAHYVKVIARDRIGVYTTSSEMQSHLQEWLSQYTMGNPDAAFDIKAQYPLRDGRVEVNEVVGRPGSFNCTVHLAPHFQVDQVIAAFRFQTEIRSVRSS